MYYFHESLSFWYFMYFLVFLTIIFLETGGLQYAQKLKICQEKWSKGLLNKLINYCIINKISDCGKK